MTEQKWVYQFNEGNRDMRDLLGGKGANLAEMTNMHIPVPNGFTIITDASIYFNKNNSWPEILEEQVNTALKKLEEQSGLTLGKDLLLSVRSGAKFSMPGMMDTILNLGLNDDIVISLINKTGNPHFVWDSYRRFIQMFSNVAMGIPLIFFEEILTKMKEKANIKHDHELTVDQLKEIVGIFKEIYLKRQGEEFPHDPKAQLILAISSVFKSWNTPRAIAYRKYEKISHDLGTAVNVQMMVFGNMGLDSGSGVLFTRNPSDGIDEIYGEYLVNSQGEDVVAGIRTPLPIKQLENDFPEIYQQLTTNVKKLENHYRDMQDIEFTIMSGKLYILQTRDGKRTGIAAVKIAHDLVKEGLITEEEAVLRVTPRDVENCMFPRINWVDEKHAFQLVKVNGEEESQKLKKMGKGLPAGSGAATGIAIFNSDHAEEYKKENPDKSLILIREETNPSDFHGMVVVDGILTLRGGTTSHAAIVSRQIGKRCIVGSEASGLKIIEERGKVSKLISEDHTEVKEGEYITLDGFSGKIYAGKGSIITPSDLPPELEILLDWCDSKAKIRVRTNADKAADTKVALEFKAKGIGLARTEHQFFEKDRLPIVQKMILSGTRAERQLHLNDLIRFQRSDFEDLFKALKGCPVTIRLIDPPLHEFLPDPNKLELELYKGEITPERREEINSLLPRLRGLEESNPMLGLRGCRLSILYPEIVEMQAQAIIEAALNITEKGIKVIPEIMIPLIVTGREFTFVRKIIDNTIQSIFKKINKVIPYTIGTMVETPRAAITGAKIAERGAQFISFGTNDLHQMTLGFSRDDVAKFLPLYIEKEILKADPFVEIDRNGVGRLMRICVDEARAVNPLIKIGICGEQGGNPESIEFCYELGLDYVSCSPFRVPVARLSAAQVTLRAEA